MRLSLKFKMIIFVVLLINLAVIAVGLIARRELALSISKNTEQIMELNAEKSAKILQDVNKKEFYLLESIASLPFVRDENISLEDMIRPGDGGVLCVEAGGPVPGLGCAGRGIIAALEKLSRSGAYESYKPDIVLYDVLGDVVCGGFTMPMRKGYADRVLILTSGEKMSVYAAANIAMAVENFRGRGYAPLGGLILNRKNAEEEEPRVRELAREFHTEIIGDIELSREVRLAEKIGKTVISAFPDCPAAKQYRALAENLLAGKGIS